MKTLVVTVLAVLFLMAVAHANLVQAPTTGGTTGGTINLNNVNNSAAIAIMGM
jgi:hypothetical protein